MHLKGNYKIGKVNKGFNITVFELARNTTAAVSVKDK